MASVVAVSDGFKRLSVEIESPTNAAVSASSRESEASTPGAMETRDEKFMSEIVSVLSSKTTNWELRTKAMKDLRDWIGPYKGASDEALSQLASQLLPLLEPMTVQLSELRSSVVKDACSTIQVMGTVLRQHFAPFAARWYEPLAGLSRVTKQPIREPADECMKAIIEHGAPMPAVRTLLKIASGEPVPGTPTNAVVQASAGQYVALAIKHWPSTFFQNVPEEHKTESESSPASTSPAVTESYDALIDRCVLVLLRAASDDVRASGRFLYNSYSQHWGDKSRPQALHACLTPRDQAKIAQDIVDGPMLLSPTHRLKSYPSSTAKSPSRATPKSSINRSAIAALRARRITSASSKASDAAEVDGAVVASSSS